MELKVRALLSGAGEFEEMHTVANMNPQVRYLIPSAT